jgi:cbb3-type cytochrome oxidase maturation protein
MSVILVLIGASLFVAAGFLIAFIWAVKDGQYDDKYTPSVRILFDDEAADDGKIKRDGKESEPVKKLSAGEENPLKIKDTEKLKNKQIKFHKY